MSVIDVRTAYLIAGLLYVVMPTVAFIVLSSQRTRPILLWCLGELALGASVILIGLRGIIGPDWSIVGANTVLFGGALLLITSLRRDLAKQLAWWMPILAWVVLSSLHLLLYYGVSNPLVRLFYIGVCHSALFAFVSVLAWQLGKRWHSASARWVAGIYAALALVLVNRTVFVMMGISHIDPVLGVSFDLQLIPVVAVFAAIIGNVGYVGMVLNRLQREEMLAIAAKAAAEEQQSLSNQIATLDRQRSLGELAAALGHELNQPLTAMLTNAQVARRALAASRIHPVQLHDLLSKIEQNSLRAEDILKRLEGLVKPAVLERQPVNLIQLIEVSCGLMKADMVRQDITLHAEKLPGQLWILGDATQLSQVLVNLLRNAIEAMQQVVNRELRIQVGFLDGQLLLSVCDTGCGLDPEAMLKAGTAFFTTKPQGLGMGLSISRTIIEQHGGELMITRAFGGGVCANITLPLLHSSLPREAASSQPGLNPDAIETPTP